MQRVKKCLINLLMINSLSHFVQGNLEASMERSGFVFNAVQSLPYKCHRINFRRGGSYIDSPD